MKRFLILVLISFPLILVGQNSPDSMVNLALLGDATFNSTIPPNSGRGNPMDVLYNPQTNQYAFTSNYVEHGVSYNANLGRPDRGDGFNWEVAWSSQKNINYITFGGTYPNQPQPNTLWAISYYNGSSWITLDQGSGGWIDSGTYEWGGPTQNPIQATRLLLEIYSDGNNDLVSIHIRARGSATNVRNDTDNPVKACLIQYLPGSGADNVNNGDSTDGSDDSDSDDDTSGGGDTSEDDTSGGGGSTTSVWSESNGIASYTGNVGIGTASVPSGYKLAVEGKIRTREVRVDQDTWPDYVFKEEYHLPSLEEIQKHIKEKGHLINIPSAKEVAENGVELGEMNKLLLEKIEELTLYILKQEKKQKLLKQILETQEQRILKLENN